MIIIHGMNCKLVARRGKLTGKALAGLARREKMVPKPGAYQRGLLK